MTTVEFTRHERELVEQSKRFVQAALEHPESAGILKRFGFSDEEQTRGAELVHAAEQSLEWERAGTAWNFISPTPERRSAEADGWYRDRRRRWIRSCLRRAEQASGWVGQGAQSSWPAWQKLSLGTFRALREVAAAASISVWLDHRAELARDIQRARGDKPAGAPPPRDSALVELAGWYEHWRLLAQRVFRERPDLMAPYGLVPGKAPPRLRSRSARAKYGEKAAGSLPIIGR